MRIAIFGVTCGIGHELIRKALEQKHDITIVSRDPSCLSASGLQLSVVKGSTQDPSSLKAALQDQDAVICALTDPIAIDNIIQAMSSMRVKRFIGVMNDTQAGYSKYIPGILTRFFYSQNLTKLGKHCLDKGIDWTIVQPPSLTFEPPTGNYRLYFNGCPLGDKRVSITDLANFMIDELSNKKCSGKIVSLAY